MKKKLYKLFVFLLLCRLQVAAQTAGFNYEAAITPVDSSGFYNIVLTPELNAHLKADYSDLRVVNDSGKWVPHVVRTPNREISGSPVIFDTKILKNESTPQATTIILEGSGENISNIIFTIKNTAAKRYCTLSGSDDNKTWFVINDSIEIAIQKAENSNSRFTLLFPPVNYTYFKVTINNSGKEPVNIISAGTEGIENLPGKWVHYPPVENPATAIFQKDSNKISYIRVEQNNPYQFERIALKVSGIKYFNRTAELYIPSSAGHSFSNPGLLVQTFTISNNNTLEFNVPVSNAKAFYLFIYNNDNLPLKTEAVKTFIDYHVATVYIDQSKQYKLLLDNSSAVLPSYDLSLKNILNRQAIPPVRVGEIVALKMPASAPQSKGNSQKLIWIVIAIAAVVLTFFTYRLVTDMNKSKS